MEQKVSDILKSQSQQFSLKEVLASYSHIELTEDEKMEGLIWAFRKKEQKLNNDELKAKEALNRKRLTAPTNYDIVKSLMLYRAEKKFDKRFIIDDDNSFVFELLCRYFGEDQEFFSLCQSIGLENASLKKGIFLAGNFGTGKTWMMNLFKQNQRQCFAIRHAKEIANGYRSSKTPDDFLADWVTPIKNAVNDATVFYQPELGICIDDIGTEDEKNNFGNKANVIGDLIELKYSAGIYGLNFHATTNLTSEQLNNYYGGRVVSRMREIFNFIELSGKDRRR
jgi:DNA replication protein DnaC